MSELTKVENGKATFNLHVPAEEYVKALETAYRRLGSRYSLPGFRKGKAPRKFIEKAYGPDVFWDHEVEQLMQSALSDALMEHKIIPELQPNYTVTAFSEENGIDFTAEVVQRPEVKLGEYKGIEAPKAEYNVTDEDVAAEILKRREAIASTENVERPVEDGDTVILDFAGFLGEEQFEGGTAENYSLKIGSHTFIPGFEEQMVGMNIGETRDLHVTFPENYQAENLAGKEVIFKVTVHSISVDRVPEFDEDFVKDTSEFNTVEEYTASIRGELEHAAEMRANENRVNAIVQKAIDNATVEIHDDIIKEEVDMQLDRFDKQLHQFGTDLKGYCEYAKLSIDDIRKDYEEGARRNLKAQYVMFAIIDAEKIEPNDDDYRSAIHNIGHQGGEHWDDAKIDEELSKNRAKYASAALYEATIRFLVENAKEV